jgi:hypothetical protein
MQEIIKHVAPTTIVPVDSSTYYYYTVCSLEAQLNAVTGDSELAKLTKIKSDFVMSLIHSNLLLSVGAYLLLVAHDGDVSYSTGGDTGESNTYDLDLALETVIAGSFAYQVLGYIPLMPQMSIELDATWLFICNGRIRNNYKVPKKAYSHGIFTSDEGLDEYNQRSSLVILFTGEVGLKNLNLNGSIRLEYSIQKRRMELAEL